MKIKVPFEHFFIPIVLIFVLSPLLMNILSQKKDSNKAHASSRQFTKETAFEVTPANVMEELLANATLEEREGTIRTVTSFSSMPEQTDSSPCIAAYSHNICESWDKGYNICASNAFARGTILEINQIGICVVLDHMNKRYPNRVDWYSGYDIDCLDGFQEGDTCPNWEKAKKISSELFVKPIGHIEI